MLKKILALLAINLCIFISIVNAEAFEDKTFGFSVNIPEDWQIESRQNSFAFFNNEKKDRVVGIIFTTQCPSARSIPEDYLILIQLTDKFVKGTHATIVNPTKLEKIAGQPALVTTLSIPRKDGIQTRAVTAAFWYNGRMCQIICSAKQEDYGAIAVFKEMLESFKFNSMTAYDWDMKGSTYQKNKEYDKAIEAFTKAIELDPKQAEYEYQLAYTYSTMGEYDQAIAEITKAIELKPSRAFYYYERAYSYIKMKNGQAALADANKAIELNSKNAVFYAARGNAYAIMGQYAEAIKDFEKQLEIKGESSEAYFNLGQCYEFLGNKEEALKYYTKTQGYSNVPNHVKVKVTARINNDWESFKEWI